jgi:Na+/melibiose symporter-like transporter
VEAVTSRTRLLAQPAYRRLFLAQVVALLGTGLLTVALSLLAFDVAPGSAGAVVAGALTIKMVAYVGVAPVSAAVTSRGAPRNVLVGADAVRVVVALSLPWVTEVWQVYVLIFVLQAASATFTPTYQALLPTVLPQRSDYTRALSYSRLAYDLESVVSPLLAAVALLLVSYHGLFVGTAAGFVLSAALVLRSDQGRVAVADVETPFGRRATAGLRLFARLPQLRAVLALELVASAAMATVLVNTVVVTRQTLDLGEDAVAVALGVFGAGSMTVALALPRVLRTVNERSVMVAGGLATVVALAGAVVVTGDSATWAGVLSTWFVLGAASSMVLTPAGQVITSSVAEADRSAAFAAHFSLSHACYLLAYPVAGWAGSEAGVPASAGILVAVSVVATGVAALMWPRGLPIEATPARQE